MYCNIDKELVDKAIKRVYPDATNFKVGGALGNSNREKLVVCVSEKIASDSSMAKKDLRGSSTSGRREQVCIRNVASLDIRPRFALWMKAVFPTRTR